MSNLDWLKRAAERSTTEAGLLGQVFATYQKQANCTPAALAGKLGCDEETLQLLALCNTPAHPAFAEQVRLLCERFGLAPLAFSRLLRQVEFMEVLKSGPTKVSHLQLAARDRRRKDEPLS